MLESNPSADVAVEHPTSERVTTSTGTFMKAAGEPPPGSVRLVLGTQVARIEPKQAVLKDDGGKETAIPNDAVFTMLGREAPLEFFRRSGIPIRGEWKPATYLSFAAFFLFCVFLYNWKAGGAVNQFFQKRALFPYGLPAPKDLSTLAGTLALSAKEPGFYAASPARSRR